MHELIAERSNTLHAVITGAAGFIGSHLADALLAAGHRVTGIDAFTATYAEARKRANLQLALGSPHFRLVQADLLEDDLTELLRACDVVFHLAGQPGVRDSWGTDFDQYARRNILATQRLLEAAAHAQSGRLVFASSSSVYGAVAEDRLSESLRPQPISPYGVSKLAAEELCFAYQRSFGLPVVVLRYFTCYGPRQRPDMAFSRFIDAMRAGRPVIIYGDGAQERDFTYVADIVTATIAAAQATAIHQPINVGSGAVVRLISAVRLLEELLDRPARLEFKPLQPGDMRRTSADLSRAYTALGYVPTVALAEGLRRQVEASISQGDG